MSESIRTLVKTDELLLAREERIQEQERLAELKKSAQRVHLAQPASAPASKKEAPPVEAKAPEPKKTAKGGGAGQQTLPSAGAAHEATPAQPSAEGRPAPPAEQQPRPRARGPGAARTLLPLRGRAGREGRR